nr:hypothetical protein MarQu_406 [Marseillevirus sp.]
MQVFSLLWSVHFVHLLPFRKCFRHTSKVFSSKSQEQTAKSRDLLWVYSFSSERSSQFAPLKISFTFSHGTRSLCFEQCKHPTQLLFTFPSLTVASLPQKHLNKISCLFPL